MMAPLTLAHMAERLHASLGAVLHNGDVTFSRVTTDTRQLQRGDLFVALRGERFDAHDFLGEAAEKGVCGLVIEQFDPAVALPQLVVSDTIRALGQIAACTREAYNGPLIAITGSSGKTTVKSMLTSILRECGEVLATQGNLNNHIGVPLTLLQLNARHEYAVIEMGASGLGEIAYLCSLAKPSIAMVNNVMPAHIAGFGSVDNVATAKSEIYQGLIAHGAAIVNLDDRYSAQWLTQLADKNVIKVALHDESADCFARDIQVTADRVTFQLVIRQQMMEVQLNALGEHSVRNALMAAACACAAGADIQQIRNGLQKFTPVAGRMTRQPGLNGMQVIDDSYNANPGSVRAAIDVLAAQGGTRILVLGDMGELGDAAEQMHADLGTYARERGIEKLLTVGALSRRASEAFSAEAQHFADQQPLIDALVSMANNEMTVLIKGSRSAKTDLIVRALSDSSTSTGEPR